MSTNNSIHTSIDDLIMRYEAPIADEGAHVSFSMDLYHTNLNKRPNEELCTEEHSMYHVQAILENNNISNSVEITLEDEEALLSVVPYGRVGRRGTSEFLVASSFRLAFNETNESNAISILSSPSPFEQTFEKLNKCLNIVDEDWLSTSTMCNIRTRFISNSGKLVNPLAFILHSNELAWFDSFNRKNGGTSDDIWAMKLLKEVLIRAFFNCDIHDEFIAEDKSIDEWIWLLEGLAYEIAESRQFGAALFGPSLSYVDLSHMGDKSYNEDPLVIETMVSMNNAFIASLHNEHESIWTISNKIKIEKFVNEILDVSYALSQIERIEKQNSSMDTENIYFHEHFLGTVTFYNPNNNNCLVTSKGLSEFVLLEEDVNITTLLLWMRAEHEEH